MIGNQEKVFPYPPRDTINSEEIKELMYLKSDVLLRDTSGAMWWKVAGAL